MSGWTFYKKNYHFVSSSLKLELARFPAKLKIQDGTDLIKLNWVEIRHVTDEMNSNSREVTKVTGTNVSWKNVNVTVVNYQKGTNKPTFKIWLGEA